MANVLVEGIPIYYVRRSHGRPLLFVHGSGADHTVWGVQLRRLKMFQVSALDLNGHGQSPLRSGEDVLATYIADTVAVLNELGPPAFLAGHSLGGAVALSVALQFPEKIGALVLIGTGAKLRVLPEILQTIKSDFKSAVDLVVQMAFSGSAPEKFHTQARDQMLRNGPDALYRDFSGCDGFDVMARLGEINKPTLIICGREDRMTPVKYAEFLRDHIPNAQLQIIEGAGHMVMREAAEPVNQLIKAFKASISKSPIAELHLP
jgi:pimeloyl-ACP methyl ester carboxylesterase